jgi:hypothetical protein
MSEIVTKPTEQDIFEAGQWFDTEFCYCEGAMKMFARAVPFSGLPVDLQALLSEEKHAKPDAQPSSKRPSAA